VTCERAGQEGRMRMPSQSTKRPERGFTLVELTISAAVASIILAASYLCLSAGVASQKMIEPRTEVLQTRASRWP
jgi:prepilin-type N-terminal cleavage/methylation domain-containing protein